MKLLRMILSGSAALIAVINGCADAVDANTVSAASDLQERMLNEQNNEPNGIGIGITSPQHESKSGKSKSAKNGSNNVNVIDKVVAFAFGTVGFLGLANKINEEESIDILTRIIRKANDLEGVVGTIDEDGGTRRLQTFGSNDNLFLAYVQVTLLKLQGLDDTTILDQLSLVFTERVVSSITGILVEPTPQPSEGPSVSSRPSESLSPSVSARPSESLSPSLGPSSNPSVSAKPTDKCQAFTLPNDGTGTAGGRQSCSQDEDCFGCKLYLYCFFHR